MTKAVYKDYKRCPECDGQLVNEKKKVTSNDVQKAEESYCKKCSAEYKIEKAYKITQTKEGRR
jgi:uncharacterized protein with PIN domain